MSREFTTTVTVTLDGDEVDVRVRAHVLVEPGLGMGGSFGAELDGDAEFQVINPTWKDHDLWLDAESHLSEEDLEAIEDALCEVALTDDSEAA